MSHSIVSHKLNSLVNVGRVCLRVNDNLGTPLAKSVETLLDIATSLAFRLIKYWRRQVAQTYVRIVWLRPLRGSIHHIYQVLNGSSVRISITGVPSAQILPKLVLAPPSASLCSIYPYSCGLPA